MSELRINVSAASASRIHQLFPTLTPTQTARVAARGRTRSMQVGEVLVAAGSNAARFFIVIAGQVEVMRPGEASETLVAEHGPGYFTGELSTLTGRPSLLTTRVTLAGEVIELDREQLQALVQTDAEISEIVLRAFVLRRVELIAGGISDVVVIGSSYCAGTLRVKEFLTRNGHPYTYLDLERDADVQSLLDRFRIVENDVPVVIAHGNQVLRNPSTRQIADALNLNEAIDQTQLRDVVVVGAGPAGLAAAVYAASEGLDVLVVESASPGGQAASSSRIENYLGFPTGISGQALAGRAFTQAEKFGAKVVIATDATALSCLRRPYAVEVGNDLKVPTRTVVIATGARYRKPPLQNLAVYEGRGVYYAATFMESQLCAGDQVIVVGGGNSAGQAAVHLARTSLRVYVLVRSEGLAASMSRYLIRRIEQTPNITLLSQTEVESLEGTDHLERVTWRDRKSGIAESHAIRHLFLMTGAEPGTRWLNDCVALDEKGFILTGPELTPEALSKAAWPLARQPRLLETSLPGVFAAGDVRSGNIKRVASSVGEGSIAVSFVHQALSE